jgi:hypothetical protein
MDRGSDHGAMTAALLIIAVVVVLLASIPYGVDSRRTETPGRFRPNW